MANKPNFKDITGQRFGRLVVLNITPKLSGTRHLWECLCDCGKTHFVRTDHLKNGLIQSCGCLNRDNYLRRFATHGLSGTPEHKIWISMVARCSNPNQPGWKNYGGRGITVCPEWLDFENFLGDMPGWVQGKSIERIDVNKGYCKENCTWIDRNLQNKNTTRTIRITFNGETKILSEWCEIFNLRYMTAWHKYKKGFPLEIVFGPQAKQRRTRTKKVVPAWSGNERKEGAA